MSCVVFLMLVQASSAHVCALKLCCCELIHASCANMSMPCVFFVLFVPASFFLGSAMKGTEQ